MTEGDRIYDPTECAVFWRTREPLGEFSNMASGFPISLGEAVWHTSEALYQACRFPHRPAIQQMLMAERSAMAAKMRSKPYRRDSRPDWDVVRVPIMRWCLRLKFQQHRDSFGAVLLGTAPNAVVERSSRDRYWGAVLDPDGLLRGGNVLGRLLQEVRDLAAAGELETWARPPDVPSFDLPDRSAIGTAQLDLLDWKGTQQS